MTTGTTLPITVKHLGLCDYEPTYQQMLDYTLNRDGGSQDQLWLLQHPPVFTQGQAGKAEHILMAGDIPVVQSDRGGQVTYHGPGQLVAYVLIDIKRRGLGPRALVSAIEDAIIQTLAQWQVPAAARPDAPGVYVSDKKIASLGLRIKQGRSFHGLALNVDMDLTPFLRINPCGYAGMEMTQLTTESEQTVDFNAVEHALEQALIEQLTAASAAAASDNR